MTKYLVRFIDVDGYSSEVVEASNVSVDSTRTLYLKDADLGVVAIYDSNAWHSVLKEEG